MVLTYRKIALLALLVSIILLIGFPVYFDQDLLQIRNTQSTGAFVSIDSQILENPNSEESGSSPYLLSMILLDRGPDKLPGKVTTELKEAKFLRLALTCTARMSSPECGEFMIFDQTSLFIDYRKKEKKRWKKGKRNLLSRKKILTDWLPPETDEGTGWPQGLDDLGRFTITIPINNIVPRSKRGRSRSKQKVRRPSRKNRKQRSALNVGAQFAVELVSQRVSRRKRLKKISSVHSLNITTTILDVTSDSQLSCLSNDDCPSEVCYPWYQCKGDEVATEPAGPYGGESSGTESPASSENSSSVSPSEPNTPAKYDPWDNIPDTSLTIKELKANYEMTKDSDGETCEEAKPIELRFEYEPEQKSPQNHSGDYYRVWPDLDSTELGEQLGQLFVAWNYEKPTYGSATPEEFSSDLCKKIPLFSQKERSVRSSDQQRLFSEEIVANGKFQNSDKIHKRTFFLNELPLIDETLQQEKRQKNNIVTAKPPRPDPYYQLVVREPPEDSQDISVVFCARICKEQRCRTEAISNTPKMTIIQTGDGFQNRRNQKPLFKGGTHDFGTLVGGTDNERWVNGHAERCPCESDEDSCIVKFDDWSPGRYDNNERQIIHCAKRPLCCNQAESIEILALTKELDVVNGDYSLITNNERDTQCNIVANHEFRSPLPPPDAFSSYGYLSPSECDQVSDIVSQLESDVEYSFSYSGLDYSGYLGGGQTITTAALFIQSLHFNGSVDLNRYSQSNFGIPLYVHLSGLVVTKPVGMSFSFGLGCFVRKGDITLVSTVADGAPWSTASPPQEGCNINNANYELRYPYMEITNRDDRLLAAIREQIEFGKEFSVNIKTK